MIRKDLEALTVAELRALAHDHEVNLHGAAKKADIIAALAAAGIGAPAAPVAQRAKPAAKKAAKKQAKPEGDDADAEADEDDDAGADVGAEGKDDAVVDEEAEAEPTPYVAKAKPELDDALRTALAGRATKKAANPRFRRHEWWRYKDLGGKHAPWRRPRGIHSKQRRHFSWRPPVVSIGYRTPAAARGLHPSGFEEVLVHRPADLAPLDPKRQAARVGGTVGGRNAAAIEAKADELGIRVLNRRS
jgi:large subunit ribosomal protein L32e